jgi:Xaa-Pro aminopeptidase
LWLHGGATNKKILKGDLIILDLGPVYNDYCADICRTFVLGKPKEEQKKLHSLYVQMQKEIFNFLRPGLKVMDVEERAHQVIAEGGFGDFYVRGTIHGIGLSFEETPFPTIFPEDFMEEIFVNMVLSTGHSVLSVPEIGGVRVEDTVLIRENGNEYLTKSPKDLLEVG